MAVVRVVLLAGLLIAAQAGCFTATTALNVRSGPSTSNGVIISIPPGGQCDTGAGQWNANGYTWYQVNYNGVSGYAVSAYLTPCASSNPPPPPSGGGGGGDCTFNGDFNARSTAPLSKDDIVNAARSLGVEPAAVKAVADVEAAGSGFLNNKPKILFEAYWFWKLTGGRYGSCNTISCDHWERSLYIGGDGEWSRMNQAVAKDRGAALQSASWGAFQIMGFNYRTVGYPTVEAFVGDMLCGSAGHLRAFLGFVRANNLVSALQRHDWAGFAYRYNGEGYKANAYDTKMAQAYQNAKNAGYNDADDEVRASSYTSSPLLNNSYVVPTLVAVAAALVAAVIVAAIKLRRARQAALNVDQQELLL